MTMSRPPRRSLRLLALSLALSLGTASVPGIVWAEASAGDVATARTLFNKGRELRDGGDNKGALEKFKGAYALAPTPIIGIELGKTHQLLGNLVEARETFLSVARLPVAGDETKKSADARIEATKLAGDLKAKIPSIKVILANLPAGATPSVKLDGAELNAAVLSEPRAVNPGKHTVVGSVGGVEKSEDADLKEGEAKEITLDFASTKAETPKETPKETPGEKPKDTLPPTTDSGGGSGLRTVGFVVTGVGVVGAVVGTVFMLQSSSKRSQADDLCPGGLCPSSRRSDVTALDDDANKAKTFGVVGIAVGVVGLGAGIAMIIAGGGSDEKKPTTGVRPWIGIGSLGLCGHF
jgi:hypothetical protein